MAPSTTTPRRAPLRGAVGPLQSFVSVPFKPQTYLNLLYLTLAFPLGLLYFVFLVVGVSVGAALLFLVVGVPLLAFVFAMALGFTGLERWTTMLLLDVEIDSKTSFEGESGSENLKRLLTDLSTLKALVYLPTKLFIGVVAFVLVITLLTTGVSMLLVPLYYDQPGLYVGIVTDRPVELHPALYVGWNQLLVGFETVITIGSWQVTTLADAFVIAGLGVLVCLVSLHVLNLFARLSGWYTAVMLGDSYDIVGAAYRTIVD